MRLLVRPDAGETPLSFSRIIVNAPRHLENDGALPDMQPLLWIIQFQGRSTVKKKRQLFQGLTLMSLSRLHVANCETSSSLRNIDLIPFRLHARRN